LGEKEDAKPMAPWAMASRTMACMACSCSGLASAWVEPLSPITDVRITECPANTAVFT